MIDLKAIRERDERHKRIQMRAPDELCPQSELDRAALLALVDRSSGRVDGIAKALKGIRARLWGDPAKELRADIDEALGELAVMKRELEGDGR